MSSRQPKSDEGRWVTIKGRKVFIRSRPGAMPLSKRVGFGNAPDKLFEHYELTRPSEQERAAFLKSLDDLPKEIQSLWRGEEGRPRTILAVAPDEFTAYHHGNWVVVPKGSPDGPVAQHEFLHEIVSQPYISQKLGGYKPDVLFKHAELASASKTEDLAMALTVFDSDREKWVSNLAATGEALANGERIDPRTAKRKVAQVDTFLKWVGGWSG